MAINGRTSFFIRLNNIPFAINFFICIKLSSSRSTMGIAPNLPWDSPGKAHRLLVASQVTDEETGWAEGVHQVSLLVGSRLAS